MEEPLCSGTLRSWNEATTQAGNSLRAAQAVSMDQTLARRPGRMEGGPGRMQDGYVSAVHDGFRSARAALRTLEETRQHIRDFDRLVETTSTAREVYDQTLELHPLRMNVNALWTSPALPTPSRHSARHPASSHHRSCASSDSMATRACLVVVTRGDRIATSHGAQPGLRTKLPHSPRCSRRRPHRTRCQASREPRTVFVPPYGPESGSGRISPKRRWFSFEGGAARIGRP